MWRLRSFSSGVSVFKERGKLNFVELFGAGSTREREAPIELQSYCCNCKNVSNNTGTNNKKLFNFKGFIDEQLCNFKIDTGSDVSLIRSNFVRMPKRRIPLDNSFHLKYPTGEEVPVKFKVIVIISLGKCSVEFPVFVADIAEDCLLGNDFLSIVNLENIFEPIFGDSNVGEKEKFFCSRIENCVDEVPPFLKELFQKESQDFSSKQKDIFARFLVDFQDIFSEEIVAGNCDGVAHEINVNNSNPIKQAPRRIPLQMREEVDTIIEDMRRQGVIEESQSPWASPAVLVKKKDGTIRFCVDYRKLNAVTKKDSYPMPRIDDILDQLSGNSWFSSLDLKSGYWQVKIRSEDKEKTAFSIGNGLWQFTCMPFGLCNAPATFERLMEKVLKKLSKICLVYLDDVIIFGKSFEEMLDHLKQVFLRLRSANLKLNPRKCSFFKREIKYLGHVVSEGGVTTDPEKISAVRNWPVPRTKKQVRSFLGFCSYYRKFVKGFSLIAKPLFSLTENLAKFVWTEQCESAFQRLKKCLMSSPILSFPRNEGQFLLDTDASNHGIGAVLSQIQDGSEKVIAYYSRVLGKSERNYCVTRRELLAIIDSLKSFHHYLYGRKFVIRTDHISLRWLMSFKNLEGQMARWLERIQQYDFEIFHRKGKLHGNADGLSRRPCAEINCSYCNRIDMKKEEFVGRIVFESDNLENWRKDQLEDPTIAKILLGKEKDQRPSWQEVVSEGSVSKIYWSQWDSLIFKNGVLFRKWESPNLQTSVLQIVVPRKRIRQILEEAHDSSSGGHFGVNKTLGRIRKRFYWGTCKQDVENWCRSCHVCVAKKGPFDKGKSELRIYNAGVPFERVQMDILGPFPTSSTGNKYLLVVSDCFTKWVEAFPLKNFRANTIAEVFVNQVISRYGVPSELHTDQGRNFDSRVFYELSSLLGIKKTRTTPFHPQSNGLVERQHQTIINYLAKFVSENQRDWDRWIGMCLLAYRSARHETTGISPAESCFGRDLKLPLDLLRGSPPVVGVDVSEESYVSELKEKLNEIHDRVRQRLSLKSSRAKAYYDRKARQIHFECGQKVWLFNPRRIVGRSPKLQSNWEGPYKIVKKLNDVVYCIRKSSRHRNKIVHLDRLASYHERRI